MISRTTLPPEDPKTTWLFDGEAQESGAATAAAPDSEGRLEMGMLTGEAPMNSRFHFASLIASGGMGEVWEGRQVSLDRVVAIKRIRPDRFTRYKPEADIHLRNEFRLEAMATAALDHPGIAPVYDFHDSADDEPFLAMKLVDGMAWDDLMEQDRRTMNFDDFLARHLPILIAMGQAVAFAHSRGIIHRDLKPSQVMVGEYGEALLMDWGLAIRSGENDDSAQTGRHVASKLIPTPATASSPAGTPAMMAPEQTLTEAKRVSFTTDVFLLGGTLYYILTGKYPYHATTSVEAVKLASRCQWIPPEERARGAAIPSELSQLVRDAMPADPANRIATAKQFVARVQEYLSGSSHRRLSVELGGKARAVLDTDPNDYKEFARALAMIDEGLRLWPGNGALQEQRQRALAGQAQIAIGRGDLSFANMQIEGLSPGEVRQSLADKVYYESAVRVRRRQLLRLSGAMIAVLCLSIVVGTLYYARSIQAKNVELARQTQLAVTKGQIAMAQSRGTSRLVEYMLKDLHNALDLELKHDQLVAESVGKGTANYYRSTDTSGFDNQMLEEFSQQLIHVSSQFKELGLDKDAYDLAGRALEIQEHLYDRNSSETLHAVLLRGAMAREVGQREEALELLPRALEIAERNLGSEDLMVAETLDYMSLLYADGGNLAASIESGRRALEIEEKYPNRQKLAAETAMNLAVILIETRDFAGGEELIKKYGSDIDQDTAGAALTLGVMAQLANTRDGATTQSLELEQRIHSIWSKLLGPEHPRTLGALNNVGLNLRKLGRTEEALKIAEEVYESWKRVVGTEDASLATFANNIGQYLSVLGREEEALVMYEESLRINERVLGANSYHLAIPLGNLGYSYAYAGRWAEGRAAIDRALKLREEALGPDHPATLKSRFTLFEFLVIHGRHERELNPAAPNPFWAEALEVVKGHEVELDNYLHMKAIRVEALLRAGRIEEARSLAAEIREATTYGEGERTEDEALFKKVLGELGMEAPPSATEGRSK